MFLMIYRGYAIFRRCEGRIMEFPDNDPNYHGNLATIGGKQIILLSLQDSLDDQLKTVVHELLHIGYEYGTPEWKIIQGLPIPKEIGFTVGEAKKYIENLEKLIERETKKVLQTQPILINHLKKLILHNLTNHPKL